MPDTRTVNFFLSIISIQKTCMHHFLWANVRSLVGGGLGGVQRRNLSVAHQKSNVVSVCIYMKLHYCKEICQMSSIKLATVHPNKMQLRIHYVFAKDIEGFFFLRKNLRISKSLTWISALLSNTFYLRTFLVFFLFTHLHLCTRVASTLSSIWYFLLNTTCFHPSVHMFESYTVSYVFFFCSRLTCELS